MILLFPSHDPFGRYAGARFQIEGGDMRLLNDDEILAVVDDPEAIIS